MKLELEFKELIKLDKNDKVTCNSKGMYYKLLAETKGYKNLSSLASIFELVTVCYTKGLIVETLRLIKKTGTSQDELNACQEFFVDCLKTRKTIEEKRKIEGYCRNFVKIMNTKTANN